MGANIFLKLFYFRFKLNLRRREKGTRKRAVTFLGDTNDLAHAQPLTRQYTAEHTHGAQRLAFMAGIDEREHFIQLIAKFL
jgi:hypothetical protein